jgi:hypothetical protein
VRFLGLGWPEWLTIIGLVGGLLLTFRIMAKASVRYEAARKAREAREQQEADRLGGTPGQNEKADRLGGTPGQNEKEEQHEDRHPS